MDAFDLLHPGLQHHIVNSLGWRELRPFQEDVIPAILNGEQVSEEIEAIIPEVRGFYFSGCTAWLVNAELLVDEGQLNHEFIFSVHEGRKWTVRVSPANDPLVRRIGHKLYKPIR